MLRRCDYGEHCETDGNGAEHPGNTGLTFEPLDSVAQDLALQLQELDVGFQKAHHFRRFFRAQETGLATPASSTNLPSELRKKRFEARFPILLSTNPVPSISAAFCRITFWAIFFATQTSIHLTGALRASRRAHGLRASKESKRKPILAVYPTWAATKTIL